MTNDAVLRLDSLSLTNFRCFEECKIILHNKLTVLVAENGVGKTAILDGVRIALGLLIDTLNDSKKIHGFELTDIRLKQTSNDKMEPCVPTSFTAEGVVFNEPIIWTRSISEYSTRARTDIQGVTALRQLVLKLKETVEAGVSDVTLPLVAYYGTGRLWSEHRLKSGQRSYDGLEERRTNGYIDCLSSSSSFKGAAAWYAARASETSDPKYSIVLQKNLRLLEAVREASREVLAPTGWCDLDWDFKKDCLVVEHPLHGRLPLSALSDGVRNMVAIITDIARRCAVLNPHLSIEAARETPGILIIDEVDMHLHPRWQQLIVGLLQKAFPRLQMILSTHSPHVLSTVDVNSIRVIRLKDGCGIPEIPTFQTQGVESADILARVMNVDPVPQVEQAKWLNDYRALIQTNEYETPQGERLWSALIKHFGGEHPVLIEVETLKRLQKFKQENHVPEASDDA